MNKSSKILIGLVVLIIGGVVYNLDAITGKRKFDKLCKDEAGARFYAPAEKDVGWSIEDRSPSAYEVPFAFGHVAFVRYEDKRGNRSDVRAGEYFAAGQRRYTISAVDELQPVRYLYRYRNNDSLSGDERFSKTQRQIVDLKTGEVVASFTNFGFRWTRSERVILSAPTGVGCFENIQSAADIFYQNIYKQRNEK